MVPPCVRALLGVLLVAALMGGFAPAASADDAACAMGDQPVSKLSEYGTQFVTLCLLNEQRAAHGLPPFVFNKKLAQAGSAYAAEMVANDFFSHTGPDGDTAADRIQALGYAGPDEAWQVGETLAWGNLAMGTPRAIVTGWMNSAAHSAVILDPALREVGIGIRLGAPVSPAPTMESATYAAEFGARTPSVTEDDTTMTTVNTVNTATPLTPRAAPAPTPVAARRTAATCRKHAHTKKQRARCARAARAAARKAAARAAAKRR